MDLKPYFEEDVQAAPTSIGGLARALRAPAAKGAIDGRAVRADPTWQASSFDLAQGLEVKVMQSKLSPETLDRLFRA